MTAARSRQPPPIAFDELDRVSDFHLSSIQDNEILMSLFIPHFHDTVVVRGASAESFQAPTGRIQLLADSEATGGALSTVRVSLDKGADGARPHHHKKSAEMFYILDGGVRLLS